MSNIQDDLVQLVRLALREQTDDVRLFVARLVRRYRLTDRALAAQLEGFLSQSAPRSTPMRKASTDPRPHGSVPVDEESRLSLLRRFQDSVEQVQPILAPELEWALRQLIAERNRASMLAERGLIPTRSVMLVGPPGVGKTLAARWIASQLNVPLFVLDLTAVMSSLLGRSGSNLRSALDFAKQTPCVLLLDEIDAIAKKRNDLSDVGELKRLVTVILQEVDEWPASGLLLAATNHPELIDPALWRRFDSVLQFGVPTVEQVRAGVQRFLGADQEKFQKWLDVLAFLFGGETFSDVEREINRLRRAIALNVGFDDKILEELIGTRVSSLSRAQRLQLALLLSKRAELSQHHISKLTGVSRDTIRKHISK